MGDTSAPMLTPAQAAAMMGMATAVTGTMTAGSTLSSNPASWQAQQGSQPLAPPVPVVDPTTEPFYVTKEERELLSMLLSKIRQRQLMDKMSDDLDELTTELAKELKR